LRARAPLAAGGAAARLLVATIVLAAALGDSDSGRAQESGWHVDSLLSVIAIQHDGSLLVTEHIDVTFDEERRGIIRDIPVRYEYDDENDRVYRLRVISVTDSQGRPHPYRIDSESPIYSIRIGDPDVFLRGSVTYVISYEIDGALNAFANHYELYWNVTGPWPVPVALARALVTLEGGGITDGQCFSGVAGSSGPCQGLLVADESAAYGTGRLLMVGEELTIVTAIAIGAIEAPALYLQPAAREPDAIQEIRDFLGLSPWTIAATSLMFALGLALLAWQWWRAGRDRAYTTFYYLTNDPTEHAMPLFARHNAVVEYTPPDNLRPASMGVLLDEAADERDLTATIIDLAVRGHLRITETQQEGFLRDADWRLDKVMNNADPMAPYERSIYDGLFGGRESVQLSDINAEKYGAALHRAQNELYDHAVAKGWFPAHPEKVRNRWRTIATGALAAGVIGTWLLGSGPGLGVLGLPLAALALPIFAAAGAMPRRTASGSEMLRRVLGFRLFIETAETRRAEFAEKSNLFTTYLPYAIVFGSADKWARAFEGIDIVEPAHAWYSGGDVRALSSTSFSSRLLGFSGGVAHIVHSAATSTAGGRGASGFGGGGSSGGGGGGGGGRSW